MKKQFLAALVAALLTTVALVYGIQKYQEGPRLGGDFQLNHRGKNFHFTEQAKKLNVLYIGYAKCPDVCPMALSHTAQAFKDLTDTERAQVQMIFISVDAAHDTPEAVATYAEQFNPGFIGLTGTQTEIDATIKPFGASYMIEENKKSYLGYSIAHTDRLYFLDKKGYVLDMISSPRSSQEIVQKIKENL